ncbi:hypothetical protein HYU21_04605, partial [Candidatus Woesearchaeota archaeon]|nr:hypothetical protein [Candidatus Woesearchaeota archaeon]
AQYAAGTATLTVKAKPEELKACQVPASPSTGQAPAPLSRGESCFDEIKNQDEEGIDCGGVCLDCPKNDMMMFIIAGVGILIVLGLVLGVFLWKREQVELPPETSQQLKAYFQNSMQEGQSKKEVVNHLIKDAGWKKSIVKKFLKENKF